MRALFFILVLFMLPVSFLYAQEGPAAAPPGQEPPPIKSELPPSPVRDAVLELLKPEQWLKTLQQYIRAPLPGTDVKDIEIEREKISELNIQISKETGVDLLRFFQFIGKVLVIILEGAARIIRGFISGV